MPKLIAYVGHKGSGKSSVTDAALQRWNGPSKTVRIGFADPMYKMLLAMGIPSAVVHDKARWDDPLDILCGKTCRYAAVTLGTEWGRNMLGDDVWTRLAMQRVAQLMNDGQNVIIDNCRFPSEFDALTRAGAIMIAWHRPDLIVDTSHESERHIPELQSRCRWRFYNQLPFDSSVGELCEYLHRHGLTTTAMIARLLP